MEPSHSNDSRISRVRLLWLAIAFVLLVFSVVLLVKVIELNSQLEAFQEQQSVLSAKVDSLRQSLRQEPSEPIGFPALLTGYDIQQLKRKGLANPVEDIRNDLMNSAELIPLEGVLGGTMQFYEDQIYVLTNRWVLAYVDDGHIAGYLWLEYSVDSGGEITWTVRDSYMM